MNVLELLKIANEIDVHYIYRDVYYRTDEIYDKNGNLCELIFENDFGGMRITDADNSLAISLIGNDNELLSTYLFGNNDKPICNFLFGT